MLIKDPVYPEAYFDAKNEPKDLTTDEANSEVKKAILATRVRQ